MEHLFPTRWDACHADLFRLPESMEHKLLCELHFCANGCIHVACTKSVRLLNGRRMRIYEYIYHRSISETNLKRDIPNILAVFRQCRCIQKPGYVCVSMDHCGIHVSKPSARTSAVSQKDTIHDRRDGLFSDLPPIRTVDPDEIISVDSAPCPPGHVQERMRVPECSTQCVVAYSSVHPKRVLDKCVEGIYLQHTLDDPWSSETVGSKRHPMDSAMDSVTGVPRRVESVLLQMRS
jgi:hypothetical protein